MRILVLSFYYSPDLSAGSFRTSSVVKALRNESAARKRANLHVEVLTTLPNRYATFSVDVPFTEELPGLTVHRFALPKHRSGLWDQSKAFMWYAAQVRRHVRRRKYDVVFATSSRLMTAALGAHVSRSIKAPLYLDIRDIFVDTIGDVFSGLKARLFTPVFGAIERHTCRRAGHINLVSEGFREYFQRRYPSAEYSFFTNGIDPEFVDADFEAPAGRVRDKLRVVYAGNMGEGQGLHLIVPELASRLRGEAEFVLIGDGGKRDALLEAVRQEGCDNVSFHAPVKRHELVDAYRDADVLFLHLNDHDAFTRVLPSKIFEYAATGKPIWAGVRGYAAEFLGREVANAAIFAPCDAAAAEKTLRALDWRSTPRRDFVAKYSRDSISRTMAADILEFAACANAKSL